MPCLPPRCTQSTPPTPHPPLVVHSLSAQDEHRLFLERVLLPLFRPRWLSLYQQQLSYCLCQFIAKDAALASAILLGICKVWPWSNSQKQGEHVPELHALPWLVVCRHLYTMITEPFFAELHRSIDAQLPGRAARGYAIRLAGSGREAPVSAAWSVRRVSFLCDCREITVPMEQRCFAERLLVSVVFASAPASSVAAAHTSCQRALVPDRGFTSPELLVALRKCSPKGICRGKSAS